MYLCVDLKKNYKQINNRFRPVDNLVGLSFSPFNTVASGDPVFYLLFVTLHPV